MKLSAQMALVISILFAALCLGYALYGWVQMGDMPVGPERDEARGYIWYWAFLGAVGVVSAIISWWMIKTKDLQ